MNYLNELVFLFVLLQIKHWYIDFVDQTMEEVHSKGIYGDGPGIAHSAKQGFGTLMCVLAVVGQEYLLDAVFISLVDFIIHYHVDWAKININKRKNYTVETPQFWAWLGFDQLLHQLTYIFIIWAVFI